MACVAGYLSHLGLVGDRMMLRGVGEQWRWFFAIATLACILAWVLFAGAVKPVNTLARVDAGGRDAAALGSLLSDRPAFADDVVFLVVASIRGRCEPAHAHELASMAARVRLPVLAAVTDAMGKDVERREALLDGIRTIATHAPCEAAFELSMGTFHQRIDPVAYAAAFPDSYFDPALDVVPQGFAGHTLAERAGDDCNRVAYAVIPLDEPRAWQCTALRASARQRVLALCHQGSGGASEGVQADGMALQIHGIVERLPPTCQ